MMSAHTTPIGPNCPVLDLPVVMSPSPPDSPEIQKRQANSLLPQVQITSSRSDIKQSLQVRRFIKKQFNQDQRYLTVDLASVASSYDSHKIATTKAKVPPPKTRNCDVIKQDSGPKCSKNEDTKTGSSQHCDVMNKENGIVKNKEITSLISQGNPIVENNKEEKDDSRLVTSKVTIDKSDRELGGEAGGPSSVFVDVDVQVSMEQADPWEDFFDGGALGEEEGTTPGDETGRGSSPCNNTADTSKDTAASQGDTAAGEDVGRRTATRSRSQQQGEDNTPVRKINVSHTASERTGMDRGNVLSPNAGDTASTKDCTLTVMENLSLDDLNTATGGTGRLSVSHFLDNVDASVCYDTKQEPVDTDLTIRAPSGEEREEQKEDTQSDISQIHEELSPKHQEDESNLGTYNNIISVEGENKGYLSPRPESFTIDRCPSIERDVESPVLDRTECPSRVGVDTPRDSDLTHFEYSDSDFESETDNNTTMSEDRSSDPDQKSQQEYSSYGSSQETLDSLECRETQEGTTLTKSGHMPEMDKFVGNGPGQTNILQVHNSQTNTRQFLPPILSKSRPTASKKLSKAAPTKKPANRRQISSKLISSHDSAKAETPRQPVTPKSATGNRKSEVVIESRLKLRVVNESQSRVASRLSSREKSSKGQRNSRVRCVADIEDGCVYLTVRAPYDMLPTVTDPQDVGNETHIAGGEQEDPLRVELTLVRDPKNTSKASPYHLRNPAPKPLKRSHPLLRQQRVFKGFTTDRNIIDTRAMWPPFVTTFQPEKTRSFVSDKAPNSPKSGRQASAHTLRGQMGGKHKTLISPAIRH